jgi:hypothetical protein
MSDSSFGRCIECGVALPPRGIKTGRERRFCSDRCRKAASRNRWHEKWAAGSGSDVARLSPIDRVATSAFVGSVFMGPAVDQAAEMLLSCNVLSVSLLTIAPELRKQHRYRFEKLGKLLRDELLAEFPQVFE